MPTLNNIYPGKKKKTNQRIFLFKKINKLIKRTFVKVRVESFRAPCVAVDNHLMAIFSLE